MEQKATELSMWESTNLASSPTLSTSSDMWYKYLFWVKFNQDNKDNKNGLIN